MTVFLRVILTGGVWSQEEGYPTGFHVVWRFFCQAATFVRPFAYQPHSRRTRWPFFGRTDATSTLEQRASESNSPGERKTHYTLATHMASWGRCLHRTDSTDGGSLDALFPVLNLGDVLKPEPGSGSPLGKYFFPPNASGLRSCICRHAAFGIPSAGPNLARLPQSCVLQTNKLLGSVARRLVVKLIKKPRQPICVLTNVTLPLTGHQSTLYFGPHRRPVGILGSCYQNVAESCEEKGCTRIRGIELLVWVSSVGCT